MHTSSQGRAVGLVDTNGIVSCPSPQRSFDCEVASVSSKASPRVPFSEMAVLLVHAGRTAQTVRVVSADAVLIGETRYHLDVTNVNILTSVGLLFEFRRVPAGWIITYAGKSEFFQPRKGIAILHHLLSRPFESVKCNVLHRLDCIPPMLSDEKRDHAANLGVDESDGGLPHEVYNDQDRARIKADMQRLRDEAVKAEQELLRGS